MDKMRADFEKWAIPKSLDVSMLESGRYHSLRTQAAWEAWQAAQSEQSAELERLRKEAAKVLHAEQIRIAAVAAVREVTGCPDIKGKDGAYLVDSLIVNLIEMQDDAAIAGEK